MHDMSDLFKTLQKQNQILQSKANEVLTFAAKPKQQSSQASKSRTQEEAVHAAAKVASKEKENLHICKQSNVVSSNYLQVHNPKSEVQNILVNSRQSQTQGSSSKKAAHELNMSSQQTNKRRSAGIHDSGSGGQGPAAPLHIPFPPQQ